MKTIRLLGMLAAMLFAAESAMAANYYVRSGAIGANNGTDWANAYTSLPSTLVRGNTYYIAGGSYAGLNFNTAASGTLVITIKGATIADHGVGTGWSNSYSVNTLEGGTQATWTSTLTFSTSYWVFDGSVGPVWSRTPSQYGFSMGTIQNAFLIYNASIPISNITISHVSATSTASSSNDVRSMFQDTNLSTKAISYVTIGHCYASGFENFVRLDSTGLTMESWTVEYNIFINGWSSPANHGEDVNNDNGYANNFTVRYNWIEGRGMIPGQANTGCVVALNAVTGPYYIYGNVFKDERYGDGCIVGVVNTYGTHTMTGVVYNNTFINAQSPYDYGGWIGTAVASDIKNNLVANSMADMRSGSGDYDAYFNTTNTPSETHGQISSANPFTNLSAGDVSLVAPTNAGISLPAPYNVDAFGHVRGADGVWDRGAIEYVSGASGQGGGGTSIKVPTAPILH